MDLSQIDTARQQVEQQQIEKNRAASNRMIQLSLLLYYPLLLGILYFLVNNRVQQDLTENSVSAAVPFSISAFAQPFFGEKSLISIVILMVVLALWIAKYLTIFQKSISDPKSHIVLFAMSEVPALGGFVIGFISLNFWASLPFFAFSLADYYYTYTRTSGIS